MHDIDLVVAESRASQNKIELKKVLQTVSPINPKVVLMIGCKQGYILENFKKAFNPQTIIGIDNDISTLDLEATISMHIIHGDSHATKTYDELLNYLNEREIDFLYLNGDHTYDGVKKDYEIYAPLVRHGGIIGFNKIRLNSNEWRMKGIDVNRFWIQVIGHSTAKYYEFWDEAQLAGKPGEGVGVYFKP